MKKTQREEAMDQAKPEAVRILTEAVGRAAEVLAGGSGLGPTHKTQLGSGFVTKEELRAHLKLPNIKAVKRLMRKRKIPWHKWGRRTTRFKITEVEEALEAFNNRATKHLR